MAKDGFGDSGRKAFRSVMATRAVLPEDAGSFVFMLLRGMRRMMILVCLGNEGLALPHGLRESDG